MSIYFMYASVKVVHNARNPKPKIIFPIDLNSNDLVLQGYIWYNISNADVYKTSELDFFVRMEDGSFKTVTI